MVEQDGKQFFIDTSGNRYSEECTQLWGFSEGYATAMVGDKYGFIDRLSGEFAIYPEYDDVWAFGSGLSPVTNQPGVWFYVNTENEPQFDGKTWQQAHKFNGGIAKILQSGKWGFIDTQGNEIVRTEWDDAHLYSEEAIGVCTDGKWGFLEIVPAGLDITPPATADAPKVARYRVRKSVDDAASQIGAFADLPNAKEAADNEKHDGYKVFDMDGNLIYDPGVAQIPISSPQPSPTSESSSSVHASSTPSGSNSEPLAIPDGMSRYQFELLKSALLERAQRLTVPEQYNTNPRVAQPGELLCAGLLSTAPGKPLGLLVAEYNSEGYIFAEFIYYMEDGKEIVYSEIAYVPNEFHLGVAWGDRFRNRYLPYETLCLIAMSDQGDPWGERYDHVYNLGETDYHVDRFVWSDNDDNGNGYYFLSSFDRISPSVTTMMEGGSKEERRQRLHELRKQWFNESSFQLNESSFQWIINGSNGNYKVNVNSRKSYEDTLNDLNRYLG